MTLMEWLQAAQAVIQHLPRPTGDVEVLRYEVCVSDPELMTDGRPKQSLIVTVDFAKNPEPDAVVPARPA